MRTRDETKQEAVMQKALEMIVKSGFDGLSMQRLAKAAGVSPATIYIYFKDKEDLLLQLYYRYCGEYFSYVLDGFDPDMDFATGLAFQWKKRASYLIDHPDVGHFLEHFTFTPLHFKAKRELNRQFGNRMHEFVSNAIRNRELISMPFEVFWSVAFAPLINLVRFHKAGMNLQGDPFKLTDKMLMQTLSLVLKALRPE